MKKLLKLIVLLFVYNLGYSQIYYSHYLDATSEWRVIDHHGEASYHDITYRTIFFEGLENLNGYTYYKMYQTYYTIGYEVDYSTIIYPQSTNITQFIGYFREDSNGKFYLYNSATEMIYFDNQIVLNSQIGDSYFNNFNSSLCQVDSLSIMNINATNYKLILSSLGGKSLEGVGKILDSCSSPQSLDSALATFIRIHCYTKQGQTYTFYDNYHLPNFVLVDCNTFPNANRQGLSILSNESFTPNNDTSGFSIAPNPTKSIVQIKSNSKIDTITVFDSLGKIILIQNQNNNEINVEHFSKGIYFVKVSSDNKTFYNKLIKE